MADDDASDFRDVRHTFVMNAFRESGKNVQCFPCREKLVKVLDALKLPSNIFVYLAVLQG